MAMLHKYLNCICINCLFIDSKESSVQGAATQQEIGSIMSFSSSNTHNSQKSSSKPHPVALGEAQEEGNNGANQPQPFGTKVNSYSFNAPEINYSLYRFYVCTSVCLTLVYLAQLGFFKYLCFQCCKK